MWDDMLDYLWDDLLDYLLDDMFDDLLDHLLGDMSDDLSPTCENITVHYLRVILSPTSKGICCSNYCQVQYFTMAQFLLEA